MSEETKEFPCVKCGRSFKNQGGLNLHKCQPQTQTSEESTPATPATPVKTATRTAVAIPEAKIWPKIIGGVCEYCGVIQGKKGFDCQHYHEIAIECFYCGNKLPDPDNDNALLQRTVYVYELKDRPGELFMVCSAFKCMDEHYKKFIPRSRQ